MKKAIPRTILRSEPDPKYRFEVESDTLLFKPQIVPNSGDLVKVHHKFAPKNQGNLFVTSEWRISDELYLMSIVIFWKGEFAYTFQIRPTDEHGIGEFVLIGTARMHRMPGQVKRRHANSASRHG